MFLCTAFKRAVGCVSTAVDGMLEQKYYISSLHQHFENHRVIKTSVIKVIKDANVNLQIDKLNIIL